MENSIGLVAKQILMHIEKNETMLLNVKYRMLKNKAIQILYKP